MIAQGCAADDIELTQKHIAGYRSIGQHLMAADVVLVMTRAPSTQAVTNDKKNN